MLRSILGYECGWVGGCRVPADNHKIARPAMSERAVLTYQTAGRPQIVIPPVHATAANIASDQLSSVWTPQEFQYITGVVDVGRKSKMGEWPIVRSALPCNSHRWLIACVFLCRATLVLGYETCTGSCVAGNADVWNDKRLRCDQCVAHLMGWFGETCRVPAETSQPHNRAMLALSPRGPEKLAGAAPILGKHWRALSLNSAFGNAAK